MNGTKILTGAFAAAGVLHFVTPKPFETIIPTPLKEYDTELVYASGVVELACAGLAGGVHPHRLP